VCSDADLKLAASNIIKGGFSYSGQRCTAVKVVLVMEDVADELVKMVSGSLRDWKLELVMGVLQGTQSSRHHQQQQQQHSGQVDSLPYGSVMLSSYLAQSPTTGWQQPNASSSSSSSSSST
jgi:acyl-CoA reductase-like NAD-dependent aldehyde dehydrogenase